MSVRVGLTLPSFVEDPEIPIAVARAAEEAGLDAVFVFDHLWRGDPPNRRPALECFALLGAVAAETTRIRVGTLVARATLRPAATLANCLRTAQRVSNGRLIAAIGAGDSQSRAENEAFGLPFGTMVDRVTALHDSVRAASGNGFPVWVAGHASPVREIVALADGWNGWGGTASDFAADAVLVREVAPDATLTWGGLVLTGADEAAAQAKAEHRSLAPDVLVGGPARLAEQLSEFVDRGAEWVILGPVDASNPDNATPLGELRVFLQGIVVRFGVHLPLMDFGGNPYTLEHLVSYTTTAAELGFDALAVNDHMVFAVPWLDGPTALAAVTGCSGEMTLATTVALSVVRGPVPLAKTLGAVDRLSGGRVRVAVGPGSSADDYAAVGIPFAERWARFDESVSAMRALWRPDGPPFTGRFYSTDGITLAPAPAQHGGPPIWIASWGSDAGLRRVARLGDGWLASAYNTTPDLFARAHADLHGQLVASGKDPAGFPNALATMWCYITDRHDDAERVLHERVIPTVHRPEEMLRERLPIGPPEVFAEKLDAFAAAGVEQVFIWPVADEVDQLRRFWNEVRPLVGQ